MPGDGQTAQGCARLHQGEAVGSPATSDGQPRRRRRNAWTTITGAASAAIVLNELAATPRGATP
jgi:hypothetical protein